MEVQRVTREQTFEASNGMLRKQFYVIFSKPTAGIGPILANIQDHLEHQCKIEREGIYTRYLVERLKGASVERVKLTRFRLETMSRPHRGTNAPSSRVAQRVVPDATVEGILKVSDAGLFQQTLMNGIGRQRAFGRGYVRLEPLRVSAAA